MILLAAGLLLAACQGGKTDTPTAASATAAALPSETPAPPTPTPVPLAAKVNGEGITLADYQAELQRYQAAQPGQTSEAASKAVLDDLVGEALLAQAAIKGGFSIDDAGLDAKIGELAASLGGEAALKDWQTQNHYDESSFRAALRRSLAAAWQRDQLAAAVPETADQVHASQILVQSEAEANGIAQQLENGADFATLAAKYDPVTGGDLGWFPQGYLLQPEVEQAAFALEAGKFSAVVKSSIGYHIVYVIERDAQHALSADARRTLQHKALAAWLDEHRKNGQIELLLP